MAGPYLTILVLLIGSFSRGDTQRYDVDPNVEWQSGRIERTQNPSLPPFTQSSPLVLRNSGSSRENVPAQQVDQQRSRRPTTLGVSSSGSRGSASRTRKPYSRASALETKPYFPEQNLQITSQDEIENSQASEISKMPVVRQPEAEETTGSSVPNQRPRFRPTASPSQSNDFSGPARQPGNSRRKSDFSNSRTRPSPKSETNSPEFESQLDLNRNPGRQTSNLRPGITNLPTGAAAGRTASTEILNSPRQLERVGFSSGELKASPRRESSESSGSARSRFSSREESVRQPEVRQPDITSNTPPRRSQPRRFSSRGTTTTSPEIDRNFRSDVANENEVLKAQRKRGRTFSAPTTTEPKRNLRQRENEYIDSISTAPESTLVAGELPIEPTAAPQTNNRFRPSKSSLLGTANRPSRPTVATPSPSSRQNVLRREPNLSSLEDPTITTIKMSSQEETRPPIESFSDSPTTLTTEGYTDALVTENNRQPSRGRSRAGALPPTANANRKPSRGEVKAQLAEMLRPSNDEISEEDNYPKEFIEKIKTSGELTSSSPTKPLRKSQPNSRATGGRSLSDLRSLPKRHMDSDVSESIHEDTIEQQLPSATKPKEGHHYQRTRYFGKGKVSTTTVAPSTTKAPTKFTPNSNVDALRQRYLDKLKQSQEERNQKLANLRPKLNKDGSNVRLPSKPQSLETQPSTESSEVSSSSTSRNIKFRPSSKPYRRSKFEPKEPPTGISGEGSGEIVFRPRFSLTPRAQDTVHERATPSVSEYSRSKNRYSRLRKEELSVEAPEAKFWTTNNKARSVDSTYNFIKLRTKDLTPLGSEHVEESVANNEIQEVSTTPTSTSTSSINSGLTTLSTSQEVTTIQSGVIVTTGAPDLITTILPAAESNELSSSLEQTSLDTTTRESNEKTTTIGQISSSTDAPDEQAATTTTSGQQVTVSTRHRFSSRYVGTTISKTDTELATVKPKDDSSSTLSISNSFTPNPSSDLSNSSTSAAPLISITPSATNSSVIDSVLSSSRDNLVTEAIPTVLTTSSAPIKLTTTVSSKPEKKIVTPKNKKNSKVVPPIRTTTVPSFLDNRPILRNIVGLLSGTSTTTKKPKAKSSPKTTKRPNKTTKKTAKPKTTTVKPLKTSTQPTSVTSQVQPVTNATTTTPQPGNSTLTPLPLAIRAEDVINDIKDVISNKTSVGSGFSISVPRVELDALTPESFLNTTDVPSPMGNVTSQSFSNTTDNPLSIPSTTEMNNVTSQPVYFGDTSMNPPRRAEIPFTTPSTTTAGDYYVFGIYPNNTVVKKRAWKTFDYEKYMSPYVIYGIYPNNTIVKKFPNGTIINDEFMTSDNEINASSQSKSNSPPPSSLFPTSTASTTTTSTTSSPPTSPLTTTSELPLTTSADGVESVTTETTTQPADEAATMFNDNAEKYSAFDSTETTESPTTSSPENEITTTSAPDDFKFEPAFFRNNLNLDDITTSTTTTPEMTSTLTPITSTMSQTATTPMAFTITTPMTSTITTPMTSTTNMEETTVDPTLNLVLPLTIEEVQTLWNGNFSDSANDSEASIFTSANRIDSDKDKSVSVTNLAFRALSTSGTTTTDPGESSTSFSFTTSKEEVTTRRPRVKFVTLTPGVVVTTDIEGDDAITMSSQHVQKVTKAPTQLPSDLLTSVFGQLEETASSPIPDILKDVGNEVEGDGLTAALARRIIALAMERAKSTTTETAPTTMSTTTLAATTSSSSTTTPKPTTRKKQSTRTVPNAATDSSQRNSIVAIPVVGDDLQNVLQQLLEAQNIQLAAAAAAAPPKEGTTTVATSNDMEKAIENQIRLAEQVRKASRTMKKKKKKKPTTTTPTPPFRLGFLFNFFNRPSQAPIQESTRTPKKLRTASSPPTPTLAAQLLSSGPPEPNEGIEGAIEGEDGNNRGQLLTAAIDVTKAVSKFMGTVINNAAQSFQTFVRGNFFGRR